MDEEKFYRGFRNLAEAADGRAVPTVRQWIDNGCPFKFDKKVRVFKESEVVEWCASRGIDFFDKEKKEPTALQQHKNRQELFKADELEFKAKLREGQYAKVSEFEEATQLMLQQMRQLLVEVAETMKKEAKLTGSRAERIDKLLIDGFNLIADKLKEDESSD